jgi:signal transduction histidine kinase
VQTVPNLTVRVDPTRFKQILLNLLSNAVKFTDPGGRIELASAPLDSGDLSLTIADTGVGIAPEYVERVFEPFEQVEDHLTRQNEGAGLGLAIARALTELHGCRLLLRSVVGCGTTVELQLPRDRILPAVNPLETGFSQPLAGGPYPIGIA